MGNTILRLDVTRRELVEPRFTIVKQAKEIDQTARRNSVYQWPNTGTYTLQPINLTTDFSQTNHWEAIKFRLTDCVYQPGWWTEVPDNTRPDFGPCDYFMNAIVNKENFPAEKKGFPLFEKLVKIAGDAVTFVINQERIEGVSMMSSTSPLPANQGYCLRFRFDGRDTFKRAALLDFQFGEFMLRLNSEGQAQLWQSTDFVTYGLVFTWVWARYGQIHGRNHQIVIYPHCRHKIEFVASTGGARFSETVWSRVEGIPSYNTYTIPGEIVFQEDNYTPLITRSAPWVISCSREFRPKFQVSTLAFVDGTNPEAFFWDAPVNITGSTGSAYPPTVQLHSNVECDPNGGYVHWALRNPITGDFFEANGENSQVQMAIGMQGIGDIAGPGLGSSITPEVYNYAIDKPALFHTVQRQSYDALVSEIVLDHGDTSEAEKLSVTTYDEGAYLRFNERAHIPLELGDTELDLLYFEGTAYEVEAGEAPAQTPAGLHIEARGMIDNVLRMDWAEPSPNFGIDPYDTEHRPYKFANVIRTCFEAGGVPASEVVIEEENLYLKDFRLWQEESTAGSSIGSGHSEGAGAHSRWQPNSCHPVWEFLDHFVRDVMGWHLTRDRSDRKWHVYKRPDPLLRADEYKLNPLVEFYSDQHPIVDGTIPAYKHSGLTKRTKRPNCTTVVALVVQHTSGLKTRAELEAILQRVQDGTDDPNETVLQTTTKIAKIPFTNIRGYPNARNPDPDITHPDFLGSNRIKVRGMPKGANRNAVAWIGRRMYEDNCFGYVYRHFDADWGDPYTYNLRKWDVVLVNGFKHYIHRIEPKWGAGKDRRARYTVSKYRRDARPPR